MKRNTAILSMFLLLSCAESDNNGNRDAEPKEINKTVVVQSVGSLSRSGILAEEYLNIYPTQMFDKKQIVESSQFVEVKAAVFPYSLIFNFYPIPYISDVIEPQGVLSYTKAVSDAMRSEEYKTFNESSIKSKSLLLAYGIYSSREDAKEFLGTPSLYRLVEDSQGKYLLLAKIVSSKFDVLTYFDGKLTKETLDNACYVSSITMGRYAYLAISTDENPENVLSLFENGILKGDMAYVDEYLKFSSVHIIERGGTGNSGYWGESGYKTLVEIFNPSATYTGIPIMFELRDTETDGVVTVGD